MKKIILVLFVLLVATACGVDQGNDQTRRNESRNTEIVNDVAGGLEKEPISASQGLETDLELEKWQDMTIQHYPVTMKYHKNWYYAQFNNENKTANSILIMGFADSTDIFDLVETEQVAPIEFNVFGKTQDDILYNKFVSNTPNLVSEEETYFGDFEATKKLYIENGQENVVVYFEQDTIVYAVYGNSKYENIIEQMAYTFKFLDEDEE